MNRFCIAILSTVCFVATSTLVHADDWNQWMGKNRDGVWAETGIIDSIPEGGLTEVWRKPISAGYAGPAVSGDRVFVTDFLLQEGKRLFNPGKRSDLKGQERIHCLDRATGDTLWSKAFPRSYQLSYGLGPRATPTVDNEYLFILGAEGHLACFKVDNGDVVWQKDLKKEYNVPESPIWGYAAHPLVHGDTLYCLAGGDSTIVAFNKHTGEEIWSGISTKNIGYCPPTIIKAGGVEQLLVWEPTGIHSLNPENGSEYWSAKTAPAYEMSIVAPAKHGDYLLCTALQGGSVLFKLDRDKPTATEVWRGKGMSPDHNPPLIYDNHIYGVDVKGHLRCIELVSGNRVWEDLATAPNGRPASSTTGFVVRNGDKWLLTTELGELIIAKMSPEGYKELGRTKMLEPTARTSNRRVVWSHPAFSNKCVFARNDKEIVCYSLAKKETEVQNSKVAFQDNFENGTEQWDIVDPKSWKLEDHGKGMSLSIIQRKSEYEPQVRSPRHIALIKDVEAKSFELTFKVKSTKNTGNHRDCCVFFNYQDPTHFYYVHLGAKPDPASGQIMIVNGAPRTPLTKNEKNTPWSESDWHNVKLVRNYDQGTIKIYFDDMENAHMSVQDTTFGKGRIGLGSFDDMDAFDEVELRVLD